ncbi:MBL fold metallo-hydrolase [Amycolatopsis magusensis]|uniref:Glyoxylase-like metal-dependent hydrolase (Beta-lactamase superfamily II) n=1 Tax=Amycolatopsis magusensis TaxID=882444 RepID=A0ABS4PZK0_9PSEU|nr:MBL fold metallo-hydrolase [Amycolatopsis magusensis]MBP2184849.1 glyoxylase-like metal-dependent hydrolase (beta-lactamase superfamily II) [Amycolatopsis magusensis]
MDTITIGEVEITRVVELTTQGLPRQFMFPDVPVERWREHENWLAPEYFDPAADEVRTMIQTWLLRSEGRTILIDTGIGNGRERPYMPFFAHRETDFLTDLSTVVRPEEVDVVITTHVHGDHVGWNTCLHDREWRPTFPNAEYVIARPDFDYWNPENGHKTRSGRGMQNVFEDSVAPVHRAGQTVLWEGDHYDVDANLRIELAPGHTPGSSVVHLRDQAVFVGDLLHNPLQIAEPDCGPCFDEDEAQAAVARRRVLEWAADHNALLLPAHFPGAGAAEVRREGGKFAVKEWATWR